MRIGYARVSTADQSLDAQVDALEAAGCERIYREKMTGRSRDRPELERMLDAVRGGDVVVVAKLDRIGRNTGHLIELADAFAARGVDFVSLGDSIDTGTATGKLFFTILAAIAQFEADLNSERTKSGLAAARARGRVGGRPRLDASAVEHALKLYAGREFTIAEITEMTGVSKTTLYRYRDAAGRQG